MLLINFLGEERCFFSNMTIMTIGRLGATLFFSPVKNWVTPRQIEHAQRRCIG